MLKLGEAVKFLYSCPFYVNGGGISGGINGVSGNMAGGFGVAAAYNFSYYVLY